MNQRMHIAVRLALCEGVHAALTDRLEISLDCSVCHRCHRTVIFDAAAQSAVCTPTMHLFPARVVARGIESQGNETALVSTVEYQYEPFVDAKYPQRVPTGGSSWARIGFTLLCPDCGKVTTTSHQSNCGNRHYPYHCTCGSTLCEVLDRPELSSSDFVGH